MKRFALIGFLAVYTLSFTEFHQVLRLPLLVEHFQEHQSKVGDITFWQFLVMHYETDVAHDETDDQLPFKDCHHSVASVVALPEQKLILSETHQQLVRTYSLFYFQNAPSLRVNDIFQPPKA